MSNSIIIISQQPQLIGIAADHGGFELKQLLTNRLRRKDHTVVDFGDQIENADDDYPDFVIPLARAVASGEVQRGIAICCSGVGASIAANKINGVRACLIHESWSAHQGVEDDDLNMICLGGLVTGSALAWELVQIFLAADFSGTERHRRRLAKIVALEKYETGHHLTDKSFLMNEKYLPQKNDLPHFLHTQATK
jgi:RpiB/LacA/LacB family sugar-phosphate isomerase